MLRQLQNLKKKSQDKGFTIIEVMIVLVIAAVIILIVFLAVPALQRNSRNNQRKNDAGRVSSAITEWKTNHNNASPQASDLTAFNAQVGTFAHYTGVGSISDANGAGVIAFGNAALAQAPATSTTENILVVTEASCRNNTLSLGGGGAVVYTIETSGGARDYVCV